MAKKAFLLLEDGTVFPGRSFGYPPPAPERASALAEGDKPAGEVVFNTGMTGYHEILTDPSYTGQIVTMTYPHIGNYGDDPEWDEGATSNRGRAVQASALVVRSLYQGLVPAGRTTLDAFLQENRISGITEVDTRGLTLHLRSRGAQRGIVLAGEPEGDGFSGDEEGQTALFESIPPMEGRNLVEGVGCRCSEPGFLGGETSRGGADDSLHAVVLDCGCKGNILRDLKTLGCRVTLMPSGAGGEDILAQEPDLVLLSNGPGDSGVLEARVETAGVLMGKVSLCGICLGHQVIAQALGARTYKMKFGHHGCNHPVRDEQTGRILITSQNHGFAVDPDSLPEAVEVWHRNANDGTIEGLRHTELPVQCVQFHPEAAPGPRDSLPIFHSFLEMARTWRKENTHGA